MVSTATATNPFAALQSSATGSNSTSSSSSSGTGQAGLTQNFNTFLTLLTTQLQHQDPLSPLDTNQFTQQLVSFSEVEQQINTNSNLGQLIQLQTANQTMSALPLIGRTIEVSDPATALDGGQAQYSYSLPSNAAQTSLFVQDPLGNVVYQADGETGAGQHGFTWNGQNYLGQQLPNGGTYTLNVVARASDGSQITTTVTSLGKVSNVSMVDGSPMFDISGHDVPIAKLVSVLPSQS